MVSSLTIDEQGSIHLADASNNKIRRISVEGITTTFAGSGKRGNLDGPAEVAEFGSVGSMALAKDGAIYVIDAANNRIRKVVNGVMTTYAGEGRQGHQDGKAAGSL